MLRRGVDCERRLSIDNGWLRISAFGKPGWGRACVCYGPYAREAGLLMTALVLNGHNTSHTSTIDEGLRLRLWRWALGHEQGLSCALRRLARWLGHPRKSLLWRRLQWWIQLHPRRALDNINDNCAVGWFADAVPAQADSGNALVMHAAMGNNGRLRIAGQSTKHLLMHGLQNVPFYYGVLLRERGALHFLAQAATADEGDAPVRMHPVGIESRDETRQLFAGVHQGVLGQIGFRADTRFAELAVASPPAGVTWYATACIADRFIGHGPLAGTPAEVGGHWRVLEGAFARGIAGAVPTGRRCRAAITADEAIGLLLLRVSQLPEHGAVSLGWKTRYAGYELRIDNGHCELTRTRDGSRESLSRSTSPAPGLDRECELQVSLWDSQASCAVNGVTVAHVAAEEAAFPAAAGSDIVVTLEAPSAQTRLRSFEAHPETVDLREWGVRMPPLRYRLGDRAVAADRFVAASKAPLCGRRCSSGAATWERLQGAGRIRCLPAGGAQVVASVAHPNPGPTFVAIPWHEPQFADVAVTITPPGTGRGRGERGRGGLVLWQDRRSYITVSMWNNDSYEGASVALFTCLDGFEDIYDAVWTMVGDRITWGKPFRLRVSFDGLLVAVLLDGKEVLYRRLTDIYPDAAPIGINRVGLAVNWEWGNDTGTLFNDFEARVSTENGEGVC
ncbi:MAG: hypothetical protein GF331_26975 [Chitinivibrionales bacterium]|nr:hypothetical protein [Chitinivibrionales bacterium]